MNHWVIESIVRQDRTRTDSGKGAATVLPTHNVFISEDTSLIRKGETALPKVVLELSCSADLGWGYIISIWKTNQIFL